MFDFCRGVYDALLNSIRLGTSVQSFILRKCGVLVPHASMLLQAPTTYGPYGIPPESPPGPEPDLWGMMKREWSMMVRPFTWQPPSRSKRAICIYLHISG